MGLSKETTANRIRALERGGVIGGYNSLVNFAKLGKSGYAVFAELHCTTEKSRQRVIHSLRENRNVYWIALLGGRYDLLYALHAKDLVTFNTIHINIQSKLGSSLRVLEIAPRIEVSHFRRNYLVLRPRKRKSPYFGRDIGVEKIDEFDREILNELAKNGREQLSEVARSLNKPRATVQHRVAQLENSGIIQSYYTQIHAQRFGFQIYQVLVRTSSKDHDLRDRFYTFSKQHPNISYFVHAIGPWDFELTLEVPSATVLQETLNKLRVAFSSEIQNLEVVITFDYYQKWSFEF